MVRRLFSPRATERALQPSPGSALAILEFQSPTAAVIATPLPPMVRFNTFVIASMVAGLVTIAFLMPLARVVTETGTLITRGQTIVLSPLNEAIVRAINVHVGEIVKKGQVLASLNPTFAAADLKSYRDQVNVLAAQAARLKAEANGTAYQPDPTNPYSPQQELQYNQEMAQYTFQVENLQQQVNSYQSQVAGLEAQAQVYQQRLVVNTDIEAIRREAQRLNVGSQLDLLTAKDNQLEIGRQLANALATAAADRATMASLRAQLDGYKKQFVANANNQLNTVLPQLAQAQQGLEKAILNRKLVNLTATQDAIVLSVAPVSVGSVMQAGQQFLTMVPMNAPLEADVSIAGQDAGYVRPGQPATIKFDTFSYTTYGAAKGQVRMLSPNSFTVPQDLGTAGTPAPGQPVSSAPTLPGQPAEVYYDGRISITSVHLRHVPPGFKLVPGMPVTVDIKVGHRTIMEYLMARIAPAFEEGMREP